MLKIETARIDTYNVRNPCSCQSFDRKLTTFEILNISRDREISVNFNFQLGNYQNKIYKQIFAFCKFQAVLPDF
jgi:hypothetical protein